jgi:hypothetical protein
MKMLIFLMFFSYSIRADIQAEFLFSNKKVLQGQLIEVPVSLKLTGGNQETDLTGKTFADTLFIVDLREGFAKIIVFNEPKAEILNEKLGESNIQISFKDLNLIPLPKSNKFIFENFEVSSKLPRIYIWVILVVLILLTLIFLIFYKLILKKRAEKRRREESLKLLTRITEAKGINEIISVWQDKHFILTKIPSLRESFLKFEMVLNKYQFKPDMSEVERIEVQEAYKKFSRSIEGSSHGI